MERSKKLAIDIFYDIIGSSLIAMAIMMFSAPNQIAPGGLSGISTLVNHLTGIPIGTFSMLVNVPLLLLGYRSLGKKFTLNTLRSVIILTICMDYIFAGMTPYTGDRLLASLFAGAFMGAGVGIVFMRGSTTGGTDIITKMILKKYPYFSAGKLIMYMNVAIMAVAALVYGNIEAALYGLIMTVTSGQVLDSIIYGANVGKYCTIITKKGQAVADVVMAEIHRGVTILEGKGAYTKQESEVLVCVVRKQEFFKLKNAVHEVDPTAFIIVTEANDIIGNGFKNPTQEV